MREVELNIEYTARYRAVLRQAYQEEKLTRDDWKRLREQLSSDDQSSKGEFVTLKRQRKLLEEDIMEADIHKTVESAYAKAMLNRIKLPKQISAKERNCKKHIQEKFRHGLEEYYEVGRTDGNCKSIYCVATGNWYEPEFMKAAHIVPKSLESEELSYLFGGEVKLSDPRNGNSTSFSLSQDSED